MALLSNRNLSRTLSDVEAYISANWRQRSNMKTKTLVLFLAILFFSFPTGSDAETANSRISAVTVYRDRAIMTRTAAAQFAAGEQVLSFENLPAALVDQSLQASGRGIAGAT